MSCIHSLILFVKAAITDNGTGQKGTKVHLQLPTNFTDILLTTEPNVTRKIRHLVYTF